MATGEFLLYQTEDGRTRVECRFADESLWLTQAGMAVFALAADYEPSLPETTQFFRIIQNKLHFAVTGQTAAELIARRLSRDLPNMGLTSWKAVTKAGKKKSP
jgi:hypothetical protein